MVIKMVSLWQFSRVGYLPLYRRKGIRKEKFAHCFKEIAVEVAIEAKTF